LLSGWLPAHAGKTIAADTINAVTTRDVSGFLAIKRRMLQPPRARRKNVGGPFERTTIGNKIACLPVPEGRLVIAQEVIPGSEREGDVGESRRDG
jgi:hypothetical protein